MEEAVRAKKKRKSEFAGAGCLVQGIGLALLFFFPIGTIVGVVLLIAGSAMSVKLVCGNCGNKVESEAKMCPVCRADFSKPLAPEREYHV